MVHTLVYGIVGRLGAGGSKAFVHGLSVTAWDRDLLKDDCLGRCLANRQGAFSIAFRQDDFDGGLEGDPEIYLEIHDRDGRLVHSTEPERRRLHSAKVLSWDLELEDRALENHVARPLSWQAGARPVVSELHLSEIRQALRLLVPSDSRRYRRFAEAILCPDPFMMLLDPLIREGWAVLEGQPGALTRFRDTLAGLAAVGGRGPGSRSDWEELNSENGKQRLRRKVESSQGLRALEPTLSGEQAIPLLAAMLQASSGDRDLFADYFDSVSHLVGGAARVGMLYRASLDALAGGPPEVEHLERLIGFSEILCGPDDGPALVPDRGWRPVDENFDPQCLLTFQELLESRINSPVISSVVSNRACPGQQITITGSSFGEIQSHVSFGKYGEAGEWIAVEADSWSNTLIEVTVPDGAGCGLRLGLPTVTRGICGRYLDTTPVTEPAGLFQGTAPEILGFAVNDQLEDVCVHPGDPITLAWRTCAADQIELTIEVGTLYSTHQTTDAEGIWTPDMNTAFKATTGITARITAGGDCTPASVSREITIWIHSKPQLAVHGIEVTQAIQHYRSSEHLDSAADWGSDNSAQLVAYKTAYVRVYLRSGQDPDFDGGILKDVSGTLAVERVVGGTGQSVSGISGPLEADPIPARADFDDYADERGDRDATLTFSIPAGEVWGRLRLTADVETRDPNAAPCGGGSAQGTVEVDIDLEQTLKVVGIPIAYEGPPLLIEFNPPSPPVFAEAIQAPTEQDFLNRLDYALALLPVGENLDLRLVEPITIGFGMGGERVGDGGCSAGWTRLFAFHLLPAKVADGSLDDTVYYGIVPEDLPRNPNGCQQLGVAAGRVTSRSTHAHEISHYLGRPHAPCGDVGLGADATHPAYPPYGTEADGAKLGEYGLDVRDGRIHPPTESDFMSYCNPDWISLHNHQRLVESGPVLPQQSVAAGSGQGYQPSDDDPQSVVSVIALIEDEDRVTVTSVARMVMQTGVTHGRRSDLTAEILDETGAVLSSSPVYVDPSTGCGCGGGEGDGSTQSQGSRVGLAMLSERGPGTLLRIRREQNILWERKAPPKAPRLELIRAAVEKDGRLAVEWESETHGEAEPVFWLRWSRDGESWRILSTQLRGSSASVHGRHLPAGEIYLELLGHDGFFTASAQSGPLTVPAGSPRVGILYPHQGQSFGRGRHLHCWGWAALPDGAPIKEEDSRWFLDAVSIGSGRHCWLKGLTTGNHELRYVVSGPGGEGQVFRTFTVK